ncbi:hypothetical protein ABFY59_13125 [Priestia aryabhattai]|uniref:hypothetical protein n=1 Tax=Priestia aryabhattai TaxID=412384 RepID=UPI003D293B47
MEKENDISNLFSTCVRASLAGIQNPKLEREEARKRVELTEFNTRKLVTNRHLVLTYLSFPLLEAILKKACSHYVDYSGRVLNEFEIIKAHKHKKYGKNNTKIISSLSDLLFLLYDNVANQDLRKQLTFIRSHIAEIDNSKDPFDVIYRWRNSSLHGQEGFPTIGGTVLNIAIIIALDEIKDKYNEIRLRACDKVQWEIQNASYTSTLLRAPWNNYPPFL